MSVHVLFVVFNVLMSDWLQLLLSAVAKIIHWTSAFWSITYYVVILNARLNCRDIY